jgi:HAD superfamily hydrolase (TIGR01549 family)
MTDPVPIDDPTVLGAILANTDALLLDFDGPICNVFAGYPATAVADQLRNILTDSGYQLPDHLRHTEDPFDLLRHATTLGETAARYVEAAFTAHEVDAIHTATPTPGAHDLITTWADTGRPLAIVSNNSHTAITTYLHLYNLHPHIHHIAARTNHRTPLKPNPHLLHQAAHALHTPPTHCTLIGDTTTDIHAAHTAGIPTIAYANKPHKTATLATTHPAAITTTITLPLVAIRIRKTPPNPIPS